MQMKSLGNKLAAHHLQYINGNQWIIVGIVFLKNVMNFELAQIYEWFPDPKWF